MPQLDILYFPSQLFWLAISFITLFILMDKVILPKMQRVFKERDLKIVNALRTASEAKEQASNIEADYKAKLAHARKMASITMSDTASQVAKQYKARIEVSDKELKKMLRDSESEIAKFKVAARAELEIVITESVKNATKSFINIDGNVEDIKLVMNKGKS